MADDLNKNIVIQITAETDQLQDSITEITKSLKDLQDQQKKLTDSGKENSDAFKDNSNKIKDLQKGLKDATDQLSAFQKALDVAAASLQKNQALIAALTTAKNKYSKSVGDNSKKIAELNTAINTLTAAEQKQQTQIAQNQAALADNTKTIAAAAAQSDKLTQSTSVSGEALEDQQKAVAGSKKDFDSHKVTMDLLGKSFEDVKKVSGEFGPSLESAAKGFNLMKTGLSVMKDGISGVGDALKSDGFDFLLQFLQMLFEAFINSSKGSKVLQGALAALNVIVTEIKSVFGDLMNNIVDAFSHPVDTLKKFGQMIMENLINRFKAVGVILDGIIHLDFKKVANGAIEAVTGVANATDIIAKATKAVGNMVVQTGNKIITAYTNGYNGATAAANKSHKVIMSNYKEQGRAVDKLNRKMKHHAKASAPVHPQQQPSLSTHGSPDDADNPQVTNELNVADQLTKEQTHQLEILKSRIELQEGAVKHDQQTLDNAKDLTGKYEAQKQLITDTAQLEITKANGNSEAIKQINEQLNTDLAKLDKNYQDQKTADAKQKAQQIKDFEMKMAQQATSTAFSLLNTSIKQQSDAKLAALQKDQTAELNNSSLTSTQKQAIEAKYQEQEKQVKIKAFKDEQEASIAQAVINGALAVTKATSQSGVLAPLVVPEIIAETAVEIAKIASQKPPAYASGGLHYASDGRGGVLPGYSRTDNTNAFLRSGEGIVVSEAMRDPWARNLVSAINVGFGGRDFSTTTTGRGFAVGGIFTDGGNANRYYNQPVNDNKNLANTIAYQMVNNFPPVYVDVKDINKISSHKPSTG